MVPSLRLYLFTQLKNAIIKKQYAPAIIRNEQRRAYLETLGLADKGNLGPFTELVVRSLLNTQQIILQDLNENSNENKPPQCDASLIGGLTGSAPRRKKNYGSGAGSVFIREVYVIQLCLAQSETDRSRNASVIGGELSDADQHRWSQIRFNGLRPKTPFYALE